MEKPIQVTFQPPDVRILIQSLGNCIDTCAEKTEHPGGKCDDCDRARALRERLEEVLVA